MAHLSAGTRKMLLVLAALMGSVLTSDAQSPAIGTWLVGKNFTIDNITPFFGTPPCPSANPNTVAFLGSKGATTGNVIIVGEFDAASIGVCLGGTQYAVQPGTTITYELYSDWVIFRVPDRVSSAAKLARDSNGKFVAISIGGDFAVSVLTQVGPTH